MIYGVGFRQLPREANGCGPCPPVRSKWLRALPARAKQMAAGPARPREANGCGLCPPAQSWDQL